jgi:site-specific DNA recombinase
VLNDIQGVIAEYEKAKILERTRRGKIHKAKSGHVIGNVPPYGYNYLNGKYQINPAEAEVVKLIFDLFTEKRMKMRSIVKELMIRNIPSRSRQSWRASTIHKMLRNETYCGITYFNKSKSFEADNPKRYRRIKNTGKVLRPKTEWIPISLPDCIIIDREIFDVAQELLRRNLTDFNKGNMKHQYLLRGLIRCGKCGTALCGNTIQSNRYYRCNNDVFPALERCDASRVNADKLERLVWDKFCEIIQQPDLMLLSQKVNDFMDSGETDTGEVIRSIETKLKNIEMEADRIVDIYREGLITKDRLKEQTFKINHRRELLETELKKLLEIQEQAVLNDQARKSITEYCRVISENLQDISNDFEAKRHLLMLIIEKIEIFPDHIKIFTVIPALFDGGILSMPSPCRIAPVGHVFAQAGAIPSVSLS